jgi:hypothetical protein
VPAGRGTIESELDRAADRSADGLRWKTGRVIFYRHQKPHGEVVEALWLTDSPVRRVGNRSLFQMAKSRWEIENQGFNDANKRVASNTSAITIPAAC